MGEGGKEGNGLGMLPGARVTGTFILRVFKAGLLEGVLGEDQ